MKINPNKPPEGQDLYIKTQKAGKTEGVQEKAAAGKTGSADKVNLSDRAKEIADLRDAINKLPDVRNDKVQEVKKALDNGNYAVDPKKIASKMLDELV